MKLTLMQEKILNIAERLIQTMGYNAFSYKDIALEVGIKTSSIHYYYPSKEDLAGAVIDWQLSRISSLLDNLKTDASLSLQERLLALVDGVMSLTLHDGMKMCLGGMLASDVVSLSEQVRSKVRSFFNVLETWIRKELKDVGGALTQQRNSKSNLVGPKYNLQETSELDLSKYLIIQLEGGLLMARLYEDLSYIELVKRFIRERF
jgi:TetR/AcrR family transcriptional repressor of nem operon